MCEVSAQIQRIVAESRHDDMLMKIIVRGLIFLETKMPVSLPVMKLA